MQLTLITTVFILCLGSVHANFSFYAYLGNHINKMPEGKIIIYNKVVIDTHKAYDTKTGKLTIPVNGVYDIGINLKEQGNTEAAAQIVINGVVWCRTWVQKSPYFAKRSNEVVLYLKAGDVVYVGAKNSVNDCYGNSYMYNNFYVTGV